MEHRSVMRLQLVQTTNYTCSTTETLYYLYEAVAGKDIYELIFVVNISKLIMK